MSIGGAILVLVLAAIATLASYISRIYSEFGKILTREVQENLDAWEERVEPQIGLNREHAALSAAVLQQLALGIIALELGAVLFDRAPHAGPPNAAEVAQAVLGVILVVVFCNQLFPSLLFNRTKGCGRRGLCGPFACCCGSRRRSRSLSVSSFRWRRWLSSRPTHRGAGCRCRGADRGRRRRGHSGASDSDLVRSAVEFGDKLVREVMTPRPEIFAVPEAITLERFLELLKQHNYSRVPVYSTSLDTIGRLAFAHDLLQITDEEARTRTVASIKRPVEFVPETKRGYELLREMQREQQHMRIVVDEYGGVAGLVTIEDLLEQIVGNIRDEHETRPAG